MFRSLWYVFYDLDLDLDSLNVLYYMYTTSYVLEASVSGDCCTLHARKVACKANRGCDSRHHIS